MSTQQPSTQPHSGNGRGTDQLSQGELTQVLQPIMSQLGQQIEQIVREQMEQTRESAGKMFEQALKEPHGDAAPAAEQAEQPGQEAAAPQNSAPSAKQQPGGPGNDSTGRGTGPG